MTIIPGSNSSILALKVAGRLGTKTASVSLKRFADGETYVRIDSDLKGQTAVIIQSAYPNQNDSLMEIAFLAGAAQNAGARNVIAAIPYIAYSRQNKAFQKGEAASLDTVIKFLKSSGISKLVTMDAHFHRRIGTVNINGMETVNLSAARILLDYIENKIGKDLLVIGPDLGSSEMIEFATGKSNMMRKEKICPDCGKNAAECRCGGEIKEYSVSGISSDADFKGRDVVIMDDMIVSGSTMIKAAEKIKSEGAKSVSAVATHGLFLGDSLDVLKKKTDLLAVTDSILTGVSYVPIAGLVADAIKGN